MQRSRHHICRSCENELYYNGSQGNTTGKLVTISVYDFSSMSLFYPNIFPVYVIEFV